jgi:hypothetical protein
MISPQAMTCLLHIALIGNEKEICNYGAKVEMASLCRLKTLRAADFNPSRRWLMHF